MKSLANMEIAPDINTLVLFGRFFSNMAEDFISFFAILSNFISQNHNQVVELVVLFFLSELPFPHWVMQERQTYNEKKIHVAFFQSLN